MLKSMFTVLCVNITAVQFFPLILQNVLFSIPISGWTFLNLFSTLSLVYTLDTVTQAQYLMIVIGWKIVESCIGSKYDIFNETWQDTFGDLIAALPAACIIYVRVLKSKTKIAPEHNDVC